MVVRAAHRLARLGLAFARDRRGSNTVEFVISIPILLAVLVLSTEYGKILHQRTVLDSAVADATRYLSRLPQDTNGFLPNESIAVAYRIISERIRPSDLSIIRSSNTGVSLEQLGVPRGGGNAGPMAIEGPLFEEIGDPGAPIEVISLRVEVNIPSPALSVLNIARRNVTMLDGRDVSEGLVISSAETYRHFGR